MIIQLKQRASLVRSSLPGHSPQSSLSARNRKEEEKNEEKAKGESHEKKRGKRVTSSGQERAPLGGNDSRDVSVKCVNMCCCVYL